MDAFTGEIRLFPYNFIPQDWLPCWGQTLPIPPYVQLFSVLGNKFGGDGKANFKLPNLSNRTAIGSGAGTGLTPRPFAQAVGSDNVTLSPSNLAPHSHMINTQSGTDAGASVNTPGPNVFLSQPRTQLSYNPAVTSGLTLAPATIGLGGLVNPKPASRSTVQPLLGLTYCICVNGAAYPVKP